MPVIAFFLKLISTLFLFLVKQCCSSAMACRPKIEGGLKDSVEEVRVKYAYVTTSDRPYLVKTIFRKRLFYV